jgi:hypothetical protein
MFKFELWALPANMCQNLLDMNVDNWKENDCAKKNDFNQMVQSLKHLYMTSAAIRHMRQN